MNNHFFLVNSKKDLEISLDFIKRKKIKFFKIISTSSSGSVECETNNLNYTPISKFTKISEIIRFGKKNMARLHKFCDIWDNYLNKSIPELTNSNIKPFRSEFFFLKFIIDTYSLKILMLKNFLKKFDNGKNKIYYITCSVESDCDNYFNIDNNINIFSDIIKKGLISHNMKELNNLDYKIVNSKKKSNNILKNFVKIIWNKLFFKYNKFVILDYGHDIRYLINEFNSKGLKQHFILQKNLKPSDKIISRFSKIWLDLKKNKKFKEFFSFVNINYFDLLENRFSIFVKDIIPIALTNYENIIEKYNKNKIRFIISGSTNLGLNNRSIIQAYKNKNVPVIIYTEGSGYGSHINPLHDNTEFHDSDIIFFYGKGNIQYYNKKFMGSNKKLFYVGSVKQNMINKKFKFTKRPNSISSIMFVSTFNQDNFFTSPFNGNNAVQQFSSQINLLKVMSSLPPNVKKFVKPHNLDVNFEKALNLPKFKHLNYLNGKFENQLEKADLFTFLFPSTT